MIPLKDNNTAKSIPVLTIFIILINILVYLYQQSLGLSLNKFFYSYGAISFEFINNIDLAPKISFPVYFTAFTSLFMHGSFFHIFGNMLYLWIFGKTVEDRVGRVKFFVFYLSCACLALIAHVYSDIGSKIPMIGASGAISGILGAYLLLCPKSCILVPVLIFVKKIPFVKIRNLWVPAYTIIGIWIVAQFLLTIWDPSGSVAIFAHIGGFFAGLLLIKLFS